MDIDTSDDDIDAYGRQWWKDHRQRRADLINDMLYHWYITPQEVKFNKTKAGLPITCKYCHETLPWFRGPTFSEIKQRFWYFKVAFVKGLKKKDPKAYDIPKDFTSMADLRARDPEVFDALIRRMNTIPPHHKCEDIPAEFVKAEQYRAEMEEMLGPLWKIEHVADEVRQKSEIVCINGHRRNATLAQLRQDFERAEFIDSARHLYCRKCEAGLGYPIKPDEKFEH